jgi:uncharacterized membrane protein YebE (DUF533 family)
VRYFLIAGACIAIYTTTACVTILSNWSALIACSIIVALALVALGAVLYAGYDSYKKSKGYNNGY